MRFLRSEIFRLVRRRMLWVLFLFIAVLPPALYLLIYTSTKAQVEAIRSGRIDAPNAQQQLRQMEELLTTLRPDRLPDMAMGLVFPIATILVLVLAGNTTGNEFGWATIRTVLTHGGRRAAFIGAKLAALALAAVALVVAGFLAALLGSVVVGIMSGADLSLSGDFAGRLLVNAGKVTYVTLPYLAFAAMVAVLARSAAAAIGFGMVLFFGESVISGIAISLNRDLRALFDAGISRNVSTITRASVVTQGASPPPLPADVPISWLILGLYIVAFVAIAIHRISKRDLTLA